MSEKIIHSKGKMVISSTRGLVLKRATLVSRGLELITELENRQLKVSDKRRKKILVVDDDACIVEIISESLMCRCGHDAHSIIFGYHSERDLMEQIHSGDYDILILGIVMPGIDGLELTRKIRSEGLDIPIILMTGYSIPINALESMRSGADDLIIKPFKIEELTSSVEVVLKQRSLQIINRSRNQHADAELKFKDMSHTQSPNLQGLIRDYYETGELMAELTYREGKLDGVSKVYRKWGTLLAEVSFRNGLADGRTKWFSVNGQVLKVDNYENGDRLRRRIYDNTGKVQQDIL